MGNASVREDGAAAASDEVTGKSNGSPSGPGPQSYAPNFHPPGSADLIASPTGRGRGRGRSPLLFPPQVPVAPLAMAEAAIFPNQNKQNESSGAPDPASEGGIRIPTIITWTYGGNEVAIEGSWDNWASRKILQRSGKDHSILLVLPSGIYHYKFIVDGERRYIPDLPHVADETGMACNILDVNDYVPESLDSIAEFEAPPSPESSYSQTHPSEEDFAKEPALVPPQLSVAVLGTENSEEVASSRPQHVVLNHLFIEKGKAPQSVVALGLTHRFQSKYVTVVLYKPLKR